MYEKLSIAHRMLVKLEKLADVAKEFSVSKARVSMVITRVKKKPNCLKELIALQDEHDKKDEAI